MASFYGETRFQLLKGFSTIDVQDQVYKEREIFSGRILNNDKAPSSILDKLTPLYLNHNLDLVSGMLPSSYIRNYNVNEIVVSSNIQTFSNEPIAGVLIGHDKTNLNTGVFPNTVLTAKDDVTTIFLKRYEGDWIFTLRDDDKLTDSPDDPKFTFASFAQDFGNTNNCIFLDRQGHLGGNFKMYKYKIAPFDFSSSNYINDYKVMHMACGPASTSQELDENGKYSAKPLQDLIINISYNIQDLYYTITPLYNAFVDHKDFITGETNYNWVDTLYEKYLTLEEKMNGQTLTLSGSRTTSLYNFNINNKLLVSSQSINHVASYLDGLDFEYNSSAEDKLSIPSTKSSRFLAQVNDLRLNVPSITDTILGKKIERFNEFYQVINLLFMGLQDNIDFLHDNQPLYSVEPKETLNKNWLKFSELEELVNDNKLKADIYQNKLELYNNTTFADSTGFKSLLFLIWKWLEETKYQDDFFES